MGALATREQVAAHEHYYYLPLADGAMRAEEWEALVTQAVAGSLETFTGFASIWREDEFLGYAYEYTRTRQGETCGWWERVHLVRSQGKVHSETATLARHLAKAIPALRQLTPPQKQRVKQFATEAALQEAITAVLQRYDVEGIVAVETEYDPSYYSKKNDLHGRYVVTAVHIQAEAYRARLQRVAGAPM